MSTKKKIIISFSTICVALVIALVTIISVFAASSQGTTAQIAVTYKASNVSARITGDYMLEGDDHYTSMGEAVEFRPREVNSTKVMGLNGIQLQVDKSYALLRYKFENSSGTAKIKIATTVKKNPESYNVRVASAYTTEELTEHYNLISSTDLGDAILTGGGSSYIYVKIDVNDPASDASFTGTVDFDLQYTEETTITGTMGIAKVGDIVERGEYPQTFVGAELNSTLVNMKGSLQATGRTFTTYIEDIATICKEYLYNNERYVMVESAAFRTSGNTFTTGESTGSSGYDFNDGDTLFFKVEPIKFQIMALDEVSGTMTLWSTLGLGSMPFDNESSGEWLNSDIRAYLNDKFLKDSYLGYAPKQVEIKNNIQGEYDVNNGTPTQDYVWLPAITDLQAWYPDESIEYLGAYEILTKKQATDFAIATDTAERNGNLQMYWLRSFGQTTNTVCGVMNDGIIRSLPCRQMFEGIIPAFVTDL